MNGPAELDARGWAILRTKLPAASLEMLLSTAFAKQGPGKRCLLDEPAVREAAVALKNELMGSGRLPKSAVAIQAIAFDKTPETNWKVTWHQDLMFPFDHAVSTPGFELPSSKEGIDYARPPLSVLQTMMAVRLHLDRCDETNGPLRVASGSHLLGIIKSTEIQQAVEEHEQTTCLAEPGEALLMRPLLLHASSKASSPKHRRVLHFVYHSGEPIAERWHRSL